MLKSTIADETGHGTPFENRSFINEDYSYLWTKIQPGQATTLKAPLHSFLIRLSRLYEWRQIYEHKRET